MGVQDQAVTITFINKEKDNIYRRRLKMVYIYANGDVANAEHVNVNFNEFLKLQGEKAINDVTATASGVLAGSSQVMIDKFLDSTGQNNTLNVSNRSLTYGIFIDANKIYNCNKALAINPISNPNFDDNSDWTYAESDTYGTYSGDINSDWSTYGTYSYKLKKTGNNAVNGNYAQITQTVNFTDIDSISFDYTFSQSNHHRVDVIIDGTTVYNVTTAGTFYDVVIDTSAYTGSKTLTFKLNCIASQSATINANLQIDRIVANGTTYKNSIIQSVATTIPTGMTKVFVTPLMYEALATGDGITADVSIDNGSNYTTDVPINEWTEITSANGTQLIVKANLLTNDGTTTPKISGWRVLLE
jgi:hypothetical protein